jgi:hypothetical protein
MRLDTLYLLGALAVAAAPLSAAAQPASATDQGGPANAQFDMTMPDACPAGSIWEPAGYTGNGDWQMAHCVHRNDVYFYSLRNDHLER